MSGPASFPLELAGRAGAPERDALRAVRNQDTARQGDALVIGEACRLERRGDLGEPLRAGHAARTLAALTTVA